MYSFSVQATTMQEMKDKLEKALSELRAFDPNPENRARYETASIPPAPVEMEAKVKKESKAKKAAVEEAKPVAEAAAPAAPTFTKDEMLLKMTKLTTQTSLENTMAIVNEKTGCTKFSQVKPEQYGILGEALDAAIKKGVAA